MKKSRKPSAKRPTRKNPGEVISMWKARVMYSLLTNRFQTTDKVRFKSKDQNVIIILKDTPEESTIIIDKKPYEITEDNLLKIKRARDEFIVGFNAIQSLIPKKYDK